MPTQNTENTVNLKETNNPTSSASLNSGGGSASAVVAPQTPKTRKITQLQKATTSMEAEINELSEALKERTSDEVQAKFTAIIKELSKLQEIEYKASSKTTEALAGGTIKDMLFTLTKIILNPPTNWRKRAEIQGETLLALQQDTQACWEMMQTQLRGMTMDGVARARTAVLKKIQELCTDYEDIKVKLVDARSVISLQEPSADTSAEIAKFTQEIIMFKKERDQARQERDEAREESRMLKSNLDQTIRKLEDQIGLCKGYRKAVASMMESKSAEQCGSEHGSVMTLPF